MADKTKATEQTPKAPELLGLDELRSKHGVNRAVFAGVCAANDWKPGKAVAEEEFLEAVSKFTKGPMSGPSKGKEARK